MLICSFLQMFLLLRKKKKILNKIIVKKFIKDIILTYIFLANIKMH